MRKHFIIRHIALVIVALAGFSVLTMCLWNTLLTELFSLPTITLPQAVGLLVLSRLLFARIGGHHGHGHEHNFVHDKLKSMSEADRTNFIQRHFGSCFQGAARTDRKDCQTCETRDCNNCTKQ